MMPSKPEIKESFEAVENLLARDPVAYSDIRRIIIATSASEDTENTILLSKLAAKLFSGEHISTHHHDLLVFATEKATVDTWFEILINQLRSESELSRIRFCILLISKFLLDYCRLTNLFSKLLQSASAISEKSRFSYLVERIRQLVALPTLISNALKHWSNPPKLFTPDAYYPFMLRQLIPTKSSLFTSVIISQSCSLGFGIQVWSFILAQMERSPESDTAALFSQALAQLPESSLEATIVPLLIQAPHPHIVAQCLSSIESPDRLLRLFHRLLLLRTFSTPHVPANIFHSLHELGLREKTEKELGMPLLRVWADSGSLQRTSAAQRLYVNQALVAWVASASDGITSSPFYSSFVSLIMSGLTSHLSCNVEEQRVLGMAVGEWLIHQFQIGGGEDEDAMALKFNYVENEAVKMVKPLFEPISPYKPSTDSAYIDSVIFPDITETPEISDQTVHTRDGALDSDDDPDPEDPFQPLPDYPTPGPSGWPYPARRPHYLRECLDGLVRGGGDGAGDDSSDIALSCFAHAADLINRHRGAPLDEVAMSLAEALLHTEPPPCPDLEKVNAARHGALTTLLCASPRRSVRYLTAQFNSAGSALAVNQRHAIISALTDAACELGARGSFGDISGEFFFPMLRGAERLASCWCDNDGEGGVYAHLDSALLARVVASLGTMYACARTSPKLPRMAEGLMGLSAHLVDAAVRDAAVRRSSLSAIGVVLTITPTTVLTCKPELLFGGGGSGLTERLLGTLQNDADDECRQLAGAALGALRDRTLELVGDEFKKADIVEV